MGNCDLSLRSSASGIRCRLLVRDLTLRQHPPPQTEVAVPAWASCFTPGRTLPIFAPASHPLGRTWASCFTPAWASCFTPGRTLPIFAARVEKESRVLATDNLAQKGGRSCGIRTSRPGCHEGALSYEWGRNDDLAAVAALIWTFLHRVARRWFPLFQRKPEASHWRSPR